MTIETNIATQPLFDTNHQVGFVYHNVWELFRAGDEKMKQDLNTRYDKRGGTIPDTPARGFLVDNLTQATADHLNYLSGVSGQDFRIWTLADLTSLEGGLVVPYINTPTTEEFFNSHGVDVWGPPAAIVDRLKNKASSHELARPLSKTGFELPEFTICEINNLAEAGLKAFAGVKKLYRQTGMDNLYPPGLMVRGAECDGGHGGCQIIETEEGFKLFKDGAPPNPEDKPFISLVEALLAVRDYLLTSASAQTDIESRVIITRLINLLDSPGLSIFISQGQYFSLGWNGQVDSENGTASFGTQTYRPTHSRVVEFQSQFERSTAENTFNLVRYAADKLLLPFESITGFFNVDLMIPGQVEQQLRAKMGLTSETIYFAECNPRWTNLTDAAMAVVWANRPTGKITAADISSVINNGLLTRDKYPLPATTDLSRFRGEIEKLDRKLSQEDTRIILRMPALPNAGFIFAGDTELAQTALTELISRID